VNKKFNIDFEAWSLVEAKDQDEAEAIARKIVSICDNALTDEGYSMSMVVVDDGITEADEEN
jgi:hypothetical protein